MNKKLICRCGHYAELHYGSFKSVNGEVSLKGSTILECSDGKNYVNPELECPCEEFKLDTLRYLEALSI